MNILFIIAKKKFDLITGKYLKQYGNVTWIASTPLDYEFFKVNQESPIKGYEELTNYVPTVSPHLSRVLLKNIFCYKDSASLEQRSKIENLLLSYVALLENLIKNKGIDICLLHDRNFIDTAAAQLAAHHCKIKIFYFASGFFRGKTVTVAPERISLQDHLLWEERVKNFSMPKITTPYEATDCYLSYYDSCSTSVKRVPRTTEYAIKTTNIFKRNLNEQQKFLRPQRALWSAIYNRTKKKIIKNKRNEKIILPERFILLPLQGNEVVADSENIFHIKNMEDFCQISIEALKKMNSEFNLDFKLIIKEHPARPFIIGKKFIKRHSDTIFIKKYDMNQLLNKASAVITFNSLAGFEALLKYKSVVMFGQYFYGLEHLVIRPEKLEDIPKVLFHALKTSPDVGKINKLIAYIKTRYEVKANRHNLTPESLYNITCKILSKKHAATSYGKT